MTALSKTIICKIDLYKLSIPLKEPFIISLGKITAAENVLAVVHTTDGYRGFGECSPFSSINGENQDTAWVVGKMLAKALLKEDATDMAGNHQLMDKIIYGNSSIKSAFDIALYDIAAQRAAMPLYQFLGGKLNKPLITDYTVSINNSEKMAADALRIKENGFMVIKVKLGKDPDEDVDRIRTIRNAVGKRMALRIDANQGWSIKGAIKCLKALAPFKIQYCEEPINRREFMQLSKVRKASPIPIMADESCCDHHDAARLIALKACDMFNLKLGKSSGLFKAQKIITLAEEAGMEMQVGGFMESGIAMTANAHLALSSKSIRYCDFDTPLMFSENPVTGGIRYDQGKVLMPEGIGLGAYVSDEVLGGLRKWRCEI